MSEPINLHKELDAKFQTAIDHREASLPPRPLTIAETVAQTPSVFPNVSPEVEDWAERSVGITLNRLRKYEAVFGTAVPKDLSELNSNGYLAETLTRLYNAKTAMREVEVEPDFLLSECLRPIVIPWQYFADNLQKLNLAMQRLYDVQSPSSVQVRVGIPLLDEVDKLAYYKPEDYFIRHPESRNAAPKLREYVADKLATDGPFGVMLMQVSELPGLWSWRNTVPDGVQPGRVDVEGWDAANMGIFEFLALSIDVGNIDFFSYKRFMLPASLHYDWEGYDPNCYHILVCTEFDRSPTNEFVSHITLRHDVQMVPPAAPRLAFA